MSADAMSWLSQAKFWILILFSIPSIICSVLILIYFYKKRRNVSLDHHLIIVLIITSILQVTIDISFVMNYYRHGTVIYASNGFCTWWNWWEYSFNVVLLVVMAWGSVERHLLVFHRAIMTTRRQRLLFHFLPLLIASLYSPVFHFIVIVLNSCQNHWDYNTVLCLYPCYVTDQPVLATYDFIGNMACPIFIITSANACLILRVSLQNRRYHIEWRRQRKLTKQLVYIAVLYMVFWFPLTFVGVIMTFISSDTLQDIQVNYFFFLIYMIPLLLPFISLNFLSNFRKTIFKKKTAAITPLTQ